MSADSVFGAQPSASKTEILLGCPRPFDPKVELEDDEPEEAARYGSAFHVIAATCLRRRQKAPLERTAAYAKIVEAAVDRFEVRAFTGELAAHTKSSLAYLRKWLTREKLAIEEVEVAYAIAPTATGSWTYRRIEAHDDAHRYRVKPSEMPGTLDLTATSADKRRVVFIDHKTGLGEDDDFSRPVEVPQMRTLGLAREPTVPNVEVAILHADRQGLPMIYCDSYELQRRRQHAIELRAALSLIGSGFLRAGKHCKYCLAKISCPTYAADLLSAGSTALVRVASRLAVEPIDPRALHALPSRDATEAPIEIRAGAIYELLKRFRALDKAAYAEIKRLVRAGAVIENEEGRALTIQTQTFETLSKKSVLDALGDAEGTKELVRLRAKGAIKESTRDMLVPVK